MSKTASTRTAASVNVIKNATASIKSTKPAAQRPEPKAKPAAKKPVAKAVEELIPEDEVLGSWQELMAGFKLPSGRRMAVSVVTQFLVLGTGIYSGFQLGALLAFGAAVLTGSAFLSFLGWFVVVALSAYSSLIAAARIGKYIALGEIDDDMKKAKAWVGDKFASIKARFASNEELSHV